MTAPERRRKSDAPEIAHKHKWVPHLYYDHPGYFKVVLSLILIHVGLAVDSVREGPRHTPIFSVLNEAFGDRLWILAVLHVLIAVMIFVGLYVTRWFVLLRWGCGVSLLLFNAIAVAFAAAAYEQDLSYYSAIASVTLSLSSLAAMKEPTIQPARRE